jgi:hypothetical protein
LQLWNSTELEPVRSDGPGFSSVRHDQLLLVPKNFRSDKRLYPLFLSRATTSNVFLQFSG